MSTPNSSLSSELKVWIQCPTYPPQVRIELLSPRRHAPPPVSPLLMPETWASPLIPKGALASHSQVLRNVGGLPMTLFLFRIQLLTVSTSPAYSSLAWIWLVSFCSRHTTVSVFSYSNQRDISKEVSQILSHTSA